MFNNFLRTIKKKEKISSVKNCKRGKNRSKYVKTKCTAPVALMQYSRDLYPNIHFPFPNRYILKLEAQIKLFREISGLSFKPSTVFSVDDIILLPARLLDGSANYRQSTDTFQYGIEGVLKENP